MTGKSALVGIAAVGTLLALSGCGGGGGGSSAPAPTASEAWDKRGLAVTPARFDFLDLTACCASSCLGNNPTSPYAALAVPPPAGAPPSADPTGRAFRLRADEAVVFVGNTPPEVKYFGFTPYISERSDGRGGRAKPMASIAETLNNLVIKVEAASGEPVFGKRTAVVLAADARTVRAVSDGLVESGLAATAINTLVLDPALARFGLDEAADAFGVLFRVAVPKDRAALDAWVSAPGATVFRVTPKVPAAAEPLASPSARSKSTATTEAALTAAVNALGDAIAAAYPGRIGESLAVGDGVRDPAACLAGTAGDCLFDNRDTTYPSIGARILFANDSDFYVVYGVDHQVSQKVSYANFSIYAVENLVGIAAVTGDRYPGSAQRYLPGSADAARLYAWKIARACAGEPYCLEVPKGDCPSGIDNLKLASIAFRTYLEPATGTAPDPATLVRDRVVRFR